MSFAAASESERVRQTCHSCRPPSRMEPERLGGGTVLCFECYRSELNRQRAQGLEAPLSRSPLPPFFSEARQLTNAEIAHRQQMLGFLQLASPNP